MTRTPEQKMFLSVIIQAINDAAYKGTDIYSKHHKNSAIVWLTGNSEDFRIVCRLAGLDADYTHKKLVKAIDYDIVEIKTKHYMKKKPDREYRPGRYRLKF